MNIEALSSAGLVRPRVTPDQRVMRPVSTMPLEHGLPVGWDANPRRRRSRKNHPEGRLCSSSRKLKDAEFELEWASVDTCVPAQERFRMGD